MTISPYQIDNILKAYSKHKKVKKGISLQPDSLREEKYVDVVTLDSTDKTAVYDKISDSLMDTLTKTKKNNA